MRNALPAVFRGTASAREYALLYLSLLLGYVAYQAFSWPIIAVDTDLWYHLNAGRFIVQNGALPRSAFFSFLEPSPHWLDYYWLSQVLFNAVHALAGYPGLIALRALVLLGTLGLSLALLRCGRARGGLASGAFIFTLVALFLIPRFNAIRPHDFSYLMIALCLFLLETRRQLWLLPIASLVWVNLHGVEYPVMVLIVGAYLGGWLLDRMRGTKLEGEIATRDLGFAGLAIACVLLTPHGFALILSPFTDTTFASQYIEELRPTDLGSLASFKIENLLVSRETLLSALLALSAVAVVRNAMRGGLRPSHLILWVGGVFLLLRMRRFSSEFVLLALPMLASLRAPSAGTSTSPSLLLVGLFALLALLPFRYVRGFFDTGCSFPLCSRSLPSGVVAFLDRVGARGDVLHHPNDGGYLEWRLFPRQKLFVDMQTPFLFSDAAVFAADQSFQDPVALADTLTRYRPGFVVAPRRLTHFGRMIDRYPNYVPVFVDDEAVLFADGNARSDLVEQFGLQAIDPFRLEVKPSDDPSRWARALEELQLVNQIHPEAVRTAIFEGALALRSGDAETALARADGVIALQSTRPEGYRLRGDALFQTGRIAEASHAYELALDELRGETPPVERQRNYVNRRLFACYTKLGKPEPAYRALKRAVPDVYSASVDFRQLFSLANAAREVGQIAEARTLLEFALLKTPAGASEFRARIRAAHAELEDDQFGE
ncbi:MAG: tetratricopeptide repeat protein [bacterium]|nr:tetratricopeptide repeat protein [bacterium]